MPEAWQEPGKGPGRFWGYRNLTRTVDAQEITEDDYTWLARLLRRHAHAQGVTREETVTRVTPAPVNVCKTHGAPPRPPLHRWQPLRLRLRQ